MTARVLSLNVGALEPVGPRGKATGFRKRPVASVEVRDPGPKHGGLGSGLVGDAIGSPKHHGGRTQAVYAVAREELDWWTGELGLDEPLRAGAFGENLTTTGLDVDAALVGERWTVGDEVVLEVCGPRIPCATFALQMGVERWLQRFSGRGRTGAYLAVAEPGTIHDGDPISVIERPAHGIGVPLVFRAFGGDEDAAQVVLGAGCLAPEEHRELAASIERKRDRGHD